MIQMNKITTTLFDFDGVVADTEPLYTEFWGQIGDKYQVGIPDFPTKIKGTTLQYIFDLYLSRLSEAEKEDVVLTLREFERQMPFPEIPGAVEFLHFLKDRGYKVGLVTSSLSEKMKIALERMDLEEVFDTVVTADRITKGKPDPMCYQLAAGDLHSAPEECVVFEDSFSGIQAGTAAGMRVIGLSTTNPAASLRDKVSAVIEDFTDPQAVAELLGC